MVTDERACLPFVKVIYKSREIDLKNLNYL